MAMTNRRSRRQDRFGVHWKAVVCSEATGGARSIPPANAPTVRPRHRADALLGQGVGPVDLADQLLQLVEYIVLILGEIGGLLRQRLGRWRRRQPTGRMLLAKQLVFHHIDYWRIAWHPDCAGIDLISRSSTVGYAGGSIRGRYRVEHRRRCRCEVQSNNSAHAPRQRFVSAICYSRSPRSTGRLWPCQRRRALTHP